MKTSILFDHIALREMLQAKIVEKNKTILWSIICFRKSWPLWDNEEKISREKEGIVGNMSHAHCMLYT